MPKNSCGDQRRTHGTLLFSPPAMCAPVIELKLSDLVAINSAHRAILPPFSHLIFSMRL